ncbi:MAG: hypothetical protein Q4A90_02855 [Streptococcus sp.]|nr:hypothetical protein [Streptococcus sp.]
MPTKVKIKIIDASDLRMHLDSIYEQTSQVALCQWALCVATHILKMVNSLYIEHPVIKEGFEINQSWQRREVRMHDVRQVGFKIHQLAKTSQNIIEQTSLRVVGQAVATGHMREHAMVASDYAIKVINLLHPNDLDAVKDERLWQIEKLESLRIDSKK